MIKKLEKQFVGPGDVKGFIFTQVKETDTHYIYRVETPEHNVHFELFEKKTSPICIDFENRIYSETESKEVYPKSNDFGVWAWTFKTYTECFQKRQNTFV